MQFWEREKFFWNVTSLLFKALKSLKSDSEIHTEDKTTFSWRITSTLQLSSPLSTNMDLESESVLSFIYKVAKNNGGYLTIREAVRSCDRQFGQLFPRSETGESRNSKRTNSCSSDSSGCSSCGNNSNTRNNDRAEANEKKLKNLIRSSEMFKLNGNVLFVNSKAQPQMKPFITNRFRLSIHLSINL